MVAGAYECIEPDAEWPEVVLRNGAPLLDGNGARVGGDGCVFEEMDVR